MGIIEIKLFGHSIKLWEKTIEGGLYQAKNSNQENKFGFMPVGSTTKSIHVSKRLMEKYAERKKDLNMVFNNLEKASDRLTRTIMWDRLKANVIHLRYIKAIQDMYNGVLTSIQSHVVW